MYLLPKMTRISPVESWKHVFILFLINLRKIKEVLQSADMRDYLDFFFKESNVFMDPSIVLFPRLLSDTSKFRGSLSACQILGSPTGKGCFQKGQPAGHCWEQCWSE